MIREEKFMTESILLGVKGMGNGGKNIMKWRPIETI